MINEFRRSKNGWEYSWDLQTHLGEIVSNGIYFAHFIIVGTYAYQLVFDTKKFLKDRGVDKTATLITRFAGSFMIATVLMAIYVAFIRSGGLVATWAFFNLVFIMNVSILIAVSYTHLRAHET